MKWYMCGKRRAFSSLSTLKIHGGSSCSRSTVQEKPHFSQLVSSHNHPFSSVAETDGNYQDYVATRRSGVRSIAIVAHVDHGKTSLVDKLLQACSSEAELEDRLLDSGDLEKERGITITSKVTRVRYQPASSEESIIVNIADRYANTYGSAPGECCHSHFELSH